jgi:O-antigen ligase
MRNLKLKIKFLEILLVMNFSVFLVFGIFDKHITKACFYFGLIIYIAIKVLKEKKQFFRNFFEKTCLNKAMFLFIGVSFLSLVFSRDFMHSQEIFFQRYIPYMLTFFIAVFLSGNKRYFKILLFSLLAGAVFVSAGNLRDALVIDVLTEHKFKRLPTSYGLGGMFATYYLCVLPFFAYFALFGLKKKIRIFSFFGGLIVGASFLYHYSRGGWIGLFAALIIMAAFMLKKYADRVNVPWKKILSCQKRIVFSVIVIFMVMLAIPGLRGRAFSLKTLNPAAWGDRVIMWKAAVNIFKTYPLLGAGPGGYEKFIYKFSDPREFKDGIDANTGRKVSDVVHLHAHSTYLEVLAELGVLGLISFLSIFFLFFKHSLRKLEENFRIYLFPFVIMMLAVLISELTGSAIMIGVFPPALFWFLFGMAVVCEREKIVFIDNNRY